MDATQKDAVRAKAFAIFESIVRRYESPLPVLSTMHGENGWWVQLDKAGMRFVVGREDPYMAITIYAITDEVVVNGAGAEAFLEVDRPA